MGDVEEVMVEIGSRLARPVLLRDVTLQLGVLQELRVAVSLHKRAEDAFIDSQVRAYLDCISSLLYSSK